MLVTYLRDRVRNAGENPRTAESTRVMAHEQPASQSGPSLSSARNEGSYLNEDDEVPVIPRSRIMD